MKKFLPLLIFFLSAFLFAEKITVFRKVNELLVQSRWSEEKDLIIHISRFANEASYLVKHGSDIRNYKKGIRLHQSYDEYPATLFAGGQGYGYLGGNHGSGFGVILTIQGETFSVRNIGEPLQDESGKKYRIVQVVSDDTILIHPESSTGKIGAPKFPRLGKKKLYRNGKELKYSKSKTVQVYPLNRITRFEYLVDGKTSLPENKIVQCDFVIQYFDHDVLAPEGMMEYLKRNPGKKPYPEFTSKWDMVLMKNTRELRDFAKLPAVMTIRNKFCFQPRGAVINDRTCIYHISFPNVSQLDQMFFWGGGKIAPSALEEFYIPKIKTILMKDIRDKTITYTFDFSKVVTLPKKMNVMYTLKKSDAVNPEDPPDRYIRFSGNGKREYGIAIGTSLCFGNSAKENKGKDRNSLYFFYPTKKMYLYSHILTNNSPGTTVRTVSYKQYFNPEQETDLTSFYYHKQEDSYVVYVDFHKRLKTKKIQFPPEFGGKRITVLEKTSGVKLYSECTIEQDGTFRFDSNGPGFFVLKLN